MNLDDRQRFNLLHFLLRSRLHPDEKPDFYNSLVLRDPPFLSRVYPHGNNISLKKSLEIYKELRTRIENWIDNASYEDLEKLRDSGFFI